MEPYLEDGIYFVAITPERAELLREAIRELENFQYERQGTQYPTPFTQRIEGITSGLAEILKEAGQEVDDV